MRILIIAVISAGAEPKAAVNWVIGEIAPRLGDGREPPPAERLARLLQLVDAGRVNRAQAKEVLLEAWASGADPVALIAERGLEQVSDEGALEGWVDAAIASEPRAVADYRAGKQQALGVLMREIGRLSNRRADMNRASELLRQKLGSG